jgi:hypothetical protein
MPLLDAPPDKTLAFQAEMDMGEPDVGGDCCVRMHPEVTSETPTLPQGGMAHRPAARPVTCAG